MMQISDYIRIKRIQVGKTLDDIAREVCVSGATVSRWESGEITNMKRDKILLLAKALDVPPTKLLLNEVTENDDPEVIGKTELQNNGLEETEQIAKFTKLLKTLPDEKVEALYRLAQQALEL